MRGLNWMTPGRGVLCTFTLGALLGVAGSAWAQCPVSSCTGGDCELSQSLDSTTIQVPNTVACGVSGVGTTPNGWARCYDLAAEGVPAGDFTVESVTFGVQQATVDGINVDVVLYLDTDDCPPVSPTGDAMEIARESIQVDIADEGTFITVPFAGVVVPDGMDLVVEVYQVDDGTVAGSEFSFRPAGNDAGQCGPSYLRADACGLADWADLANIGGGFPDAHLILNVSGSVDVGPTTCEGDVNGDGVVNVLDLLEVIFSFGECPAPPEPCPTDINGDGIVDVLDLLLVVRNWGACVPECETNQDCDDGDPCTIDLCVRGTCYHLQLPNCP